MSRRRNLEAVHDPVRPEEAVKKMAERRFLVAGSAGTQPTQSYAAKIDKALAKPYRIQAPEKEKG